MVAQNNLHFSDVICGQQIKKGVGKKFANGKTVVIEFPDYY
jgi:hypothetical protein